MTIDVISIGGGAARLWIESFALHTHRPLHVPPIMRASKWNGRGGTSIIYRASNAPAHCVERTGFVANAGLAIVSGRAPIGQLTAMRMPHQIRNFVMGTETLKMKSLVP